MLCKPLLILSFVQLFHFGRQQQREIKVGVLIPRNEIKLFINEIGRKHLSTSSLQLNIPLLSYTGTHSQSGYEDFVGYDRSIGGLIVASFFVNQKRLIPGFNFTFNVQDDRCMESDATGHAVDLIEDSQIELLIGPACSDPANRVGSVAKFFNVPLFTWGMTSSQQLINVTKFPTLVSTSGTTLSLTYAFIDVMDYFSWDRFAYIYSSSDQEQRCSDIQSGFDAIVGASDVDMTYFRQMDPNAVDLATLQVALRSASNYARIIALCFERDDAKRTFFLAAASLNMTTDDYVYIILEFRGLSFNAPISMNSSMWGYINDLTNASWPASLKDVDPTTLGNGLLPIWIDQFTPIDGMDNIAKKAMSKAFVLDLIQAGILNRTLLIEEILGYASGPPFNCAACVELGAISVFAKELVDALILYSYGLNQTLDELPSTNASSSIYNMNLRLGKEIAQNLRGFGFTGYSGNVSIDANGVRVSLIQLSGMDSNFVRIPYFNCAANSTQNVLTANFTNESSTIWLLRSGIRPLSVPTCGFDGSQCVASFWSSYGALIYSAAGLLLILILLTVAFLVRGRYQEYKRLNAAWMISHTDLLVPYKSNSDMQSMRSVHTQTTVLSKTETENFAFYQLYDELVAARKFTAKPPIKGHDFVEFRFMRQIENDNLAKFMGFCINGPQYLSVWRYYMRGSIEDIIAKGSYAIDAAFMTSLIRDIANGLNFIHNSILHVHGHLNTSNCLVDDRWAVKISDFGTTGLFQHEPVSQKSMLYMAPEILRRQGHPLSLPSTKEADVYSFGIVCAEVINRRPAWEVNTNQTSDPDELIYMIKRQQREVPIRPVIDASLIADLNSGIPHLIRDCWSENPSQRPGVSQIRNLIRNMGGRNESLMDHVFRILEHYTTTLQEEVEERTRELLEEKKRSDVLLYRLLPRQIADKLKMGSVIEPESFDSVTIFFSDVVRFSELSRQSTALQAITLLNDLFTMFDGIIEQYDCYKVESVGDDTLVASGLPRRNGIQHAKEIASMALNFMEGVENFRIPHLPHERVELRLGFHSGPCVAGVVGLAMPRYCLFGDTVNTASRMCSNSKPGRIHLSSDANNLLQMIGGFTTTSRGDLIIKGKGVMETFFLEKHEDEITNPSIHSASTDKEDEQETPLVTGHDASRVNVFFNS